MKETYHIHINGLVQGVGFRPYVCRIAQSMQMTGVVNNSNDGVHIKITACPSNAEKFYNHIITHPPQGAIITSHTIKKEALQLFTSFSIIESAPNTEAAILLTPDVAICKNCKQEMEEPFNKRKGYAFTTCVHCGPRYSIITALPYDRANTTMANLEMCDSCRDEYSTINNSRHYSQTNSCNSCAIPMHLFSSATNECKTRDGEKIIEMLVSILQSGKIAAVKGIGGYLLVCDATNEEVVNTLRQRKHRPAKPFAVLYPSIEMAQMDTDISTIEKQALQSDQAPIVLCKKKSKTSTANAVAPGLDKIGVMLPYAPLLYLIATKCNKPLIATSGNISGAAIIYNDDDALENLFDIADYILTYEREIVVPQDDSVVQFTESGQRIIIRRSRGLAPNYFPNPLGFSNQTVLATGAELKSAFAILHKNNLFISQYLGDQQALESQESYLHTLAHLQQLLKIIPSVVITDKHPAYNISMLANAYARQYQISCVHTTQHHKAHFTSVLAENNLLQTNEHIAGIVWDGTGWGDDEQIWGSEIFLFENKEMKRVAHLDYFPVVAGDKMSLEPRLSALSLLQHMPEAQHIIQPMFSEAEWTFYQKLLQTTNGLQTSSMGRFLDGIGAILGICNKNTYEGECAMQMEALARNCKEEIDDHYLLYLEENMIKWQKFIEGVIDDVKHKQDRSFICRKVFYSLAKAIGELRAHLNINALAFSGGVFQNALLADFIIAGLGKNNKLYFHKQLSPNDECIALGQLACWALKIDAI